jgi:hypothetical protein
MPLPFPASAVGFAVYRELGNSRSPAIRPEWRGRMNDEQKLKQAEIAIATMLEECRHLSIEAILAAGGARELAKAALTAAHAIAPDHPR